MEMKRQVSWQSRKRYSEKGESAKRRTEQNVVCVFRIKGRSIVDFPGRYLSDSSRHSWRHLRFSILRKRTATEHVLRASIFFFLIFFLALVLRVLRWYPRRSHFLYLQRIKSFTSCAELEKSNEAFVGSTNRVSLPEPVTNAIRKSTRKIIHGIASGWSDIFFEFFNDLLICYDRHGWKSKNSVRFLACWDCHLFKITSQNIKILLRIIFSLCWID